MRISILVSVSDILQTVVIFLFLSLSPSARDEWIILQLQFNIYDLLIELLTGLYPHYILYRL